MKQILTVKFAIFFGSFLWKFNTKYWQLCLQYIFAPGHNLVSCRAKISQGLGVCHLSWTGSTHLLCILLVRSSIFSSLLMLFWHFWYLIRHIPLLCNMSRKQGWTQKDATLTLVSWKLNPLLRRNFWRHNIHMIYNLIQYVYKYVWGVLKNPPSRHGLDSHS